MDRERYQTVFARERGSVAAPTAGSTSPRSPGPNPRPGCAHRSSDAPCGTGDVPACAGERGLGYPSPRERYSLPEDTANRQPRATRGPACGGCRDHHRSGTGALCPHWPAGGPYRYDRHLSLPGSHLQVVRRPSPTFICRSRLLLMLVSAFAGKEKTLARIAMRSKPVIASSPTVTACSSPLREKPRQTQVTVDTRGENALGKVPFGVEACAFQRRFHQPLGFDQLRIFASRHLYVASPADRYARERLGDEEADPMISGSMLFPDGRRRCRSSSRELGQFHCAGFDFVDRAAWAIRGEDRRVSALDCLGQRPQARCLRTGYSSRARSENQSFDSARDQFPIEAAADQNRRLKSIMKIASTRDKTAMPEAPHLQSRWRRGICPRLHHDLVT